jgi:hypothetical protein
MPSFVPGEVVVMAGPSLLVTVGSGRVQRLSGTECAAYPLEVDVTAGLEKLREPHG